MLNFRKAVDLDRGANSRRAVTREAYAESVQLVISVAMCTRNGAEYIEQQVSSILDQTLAPVEIVLSDDASTDDTVALAEAAVARHDGDVVLRILRNRSALGVTANFEQAIRETRGELVALCDQDDVWHPDRLRRVVAEFETRPQLTLLHGDTRLVDESGASIGGTLFDALEVSRWEIERISSGNAFDALIRRNLVTGATAVFRRELLDIAAPFPTGWVHDEWLAIIAASTGDVDFIAEPLVDYRQHSTNQIGAARLTIAGKVTRMFEPRRARNERLATNFATLDARLELIDGISDRVREITRRKRDHEIARNAYPASRLRRLGPIAREYRTGRYALSAHGSLDVVRDLLQSADWGG